VAVKCAEAFGLKELIVAGDSPFVCDKDPRKFADAKPIREINWTDFQKLIPCEWKPGLSTPVDPAATKAAKKLKMIVKLIKGTSLDDFQKAIDNEPFEGSVIQGK
jgi:uridylate kinase